MLARFVWEILGPLAIVGVLGWFVARRQNLAIGRYLTAERDRLRATILVVVVVLVAIAVTYALGSPPRLDGRYDFDPYHVSLLAFLVGSYLTMHAARQYDLATTLRDAEPTTTDSLPGSGLVRVNGTIESTGDTMTAPYTGTACVAVEAGTLLADPSVVGTWNPNRAHHLVDDEQWITPFRITDREGSVIVDASAVHFSFIRDERVDDGTLVERRLEPGQPVTVVGRIEAGGIRGDPVLVASPHNPNLDRFERNVPRFAVLGPVVAVAGFLGMSITAGLV